MLASHATNIGKLIVLYLLTLLTFLVLDGVWLGVVARTMYQRQIGHLLAPNVRWGAAAAFYLIYIAGLLVLVVLPHRSAPVLLTAALGAAFGFVAYAS